MKDIYILLAEEEHAAKVIEVFDNKDEATVFKEIFSSVFFYNNDELSIMCIDGNNIIEC